MVNRVRPMLIKSQQQWAQNGISEQAMAELELQRKQIGEIERRMEIFSSPNMHIKMSTYPRNKLDLFCQLLTSAYSPTKKFSFQYPGRAITTRCTYRRSTDLQNEKIDVETDVEEFTANLFSTKHVQTEPPVDPDADSDDEGDPADPLDQAGDRLTRETCLSNRTVQQGTILAQNEVDRIASNGENLLYFSETSKSLCYITNFLSTKQANGVSMTEEISCRWPHHPILDMTYSPTSSQFICATKNGIYTATINGSNIDFQLQLTQLCSYVRIAADKNFIWLWTDTPRSSQLRTYSPRTFTCVKIFNLNDYPRFSDNSTSFCIYGNTLATLFQFKQASNAKSYRKLFHLTFCNSSDLRETCTIRLGACEIDHEVRVNQAGLCFVTNGKRKLWIVDQKGKKEFVKLTRPGRALTIHQSNQIIIANGTQQLQRVELSWDRKKRRSARRVWCFSSLLCVLFSLALRMKREREKNLFE